MQILKEKFNRMVDIQAMEIFVSQMGKAYVKRHKKKKKLDKVNISGSCEC